MRDRGADGDIERCGVAAGVPEAGNARRVAERWTATFTV